MLPFLSNAQENALTRISATDRSDGNGQVVRFHLNERADSFRVYQPTPELVQIAVYGESIDTAGVLLPRIRESLDEVSFYDIPSGIGVDFYIPKDIWYNARAYHDRTSNDLLLGLTHTSREEVELLAQGVEPVIWTENTIMAESLLVQNGVDPPTLDENYDRMRDRLRFDVVVIDAGHGDWEPGSIGYRGIQEKDVTLAIAKKVGGYIEEYMPDVKVVYTRDDDTYVELEERGSIANRAEGDLFLSIHCNAADARQAHGTETFFLGMGRSNSALETMKRENSVVRFEDDPAQEELSQEDLAIYELMNSGYIATSERIAVMIEDQFANRAQRRSRGVKQAGLVVLYHASMPAVLVETGFISNPSEARYLTSEYGQSIIASAIFRAVRNFKVEYDKNQHYNETK